MQNIKELTNLELMKAITKCDREILKMLQVEIENYPGAIMGLGDFYVEKYILIDELYERRTKL